MAASLVCVYQHYGHCKFGTMCRKKHESETCSIFLCSQDTCRKRHPKVCRYFTLFGACKFRDNCSFLHLTPPAIRLSKLEEEIKHLQGLIASISEEVIGINTKAAALESSQRSCYNEGIPQVDGQIDPIFKCDRCEGSFDEIEMLVKHVVRHVYEENGATNEKILALETRIQEIHDTNYILIHSVDDLENDIKILEINTNCQTYLFRCDTCGQSFEKKSYWREHMKNYH